MKAIKTTSTAKPEASFANELKELLLADLRAFKTKVISLGSNNQVTVYTFSAA